MAIKNNNMHKIPNYDYEHLGHLKKVIKTYTKGKYSGLFKYSYSAGTFNN